LPVLKNVIQVMIIGNPVDLSKLSYMRAHAYI
jgi:hypothetical protein